MKVKREIESTRVKGICFHPSRSLVLYSNHNGTVHLYDYDIGVELSSYNVCDNTPVRCCAFHPTQPIFAVGTDEYNVVVYNWQKKVKLFQLEGHTDFVRSVEFHSVYPLLISSSDDSTARIWNWQSRCCVCILDDHTYYVMSARFNPKEPLVATACLDECVRLFNIGPLVSGSMSKDVESASFFSLEQNSSFLHEAEEHPEGANTVAWDDEGKYLFSGGEDGTVKKYRISNDELNVIATNEVSSLAITCVVYHPATGNLIACGEDSILRVLNGQTLSQIAEYKCPPSRFWAAAAHPKDALVCGGHDNGLVILKTNKERTPFDVQANSVAWLQQNELHVVDVQTKQQEKPVCVTPGVSRVSWNPSRSIALLSFEKDGTEIYEAVDITMKNPIIRGEGSFATWISRSSVCSLAKGGDKLLVGELGQNPRHIKIPRAVRICSASPQKVFIITTKSIILYDIPRSKEEAKCSFSNCKALALNDDRTQVCGRSSHGVFVAPIDLSRVEEHSEKSKVKSVCFCGEFVLYTTRTHLKYIVAGESGVVCSLPRVLYIIKATGNTAWFVTRDGIVFKREIELGEVRLKQALSKNIDGYNIARRIVAENPPIGFSVMEFAANAGKFDIAASLARDPRTRFEMSLKAGDFDTASECATEINDKDIFEQLARASIESGKITLAEEAYKKAGDVESLAFLYLITGKKEQIQKINENNPNNPLLMIWANDGVGLDNLLSSSSEALGETLKDKIEDISIDYGIPVDGDWPTTMATYVPMPTKEEIEMGGDEDAEWPMSSSEGENEEEDEEMGWDLDGDLDLDIDADNEAAKQTKGRMVCPPRGEGIHEKWSKSASTVGDLAAAGQFGDAIVLLKETVGAINFDPIKQLLVDAYIRSNACLSTSFGQLSVPISSEFRGKTVPALVPSVGELDWLMKSAHSAFGKGKFADCRSLCVRLIQTALTATVETRDEENRIKEMIESAMNYALGVSMEIARKLEPGDARGVELAAYFTHVKILPPHLRLALQSGMRVALKAGCNSVAKSLAQRLLDLSPPEKVAKAAKATLSAASKSPTNAHQIDYNERNPFQVCAVSFRPIYRGTASVQCPLCGCRALPSYTGDLCPICNIAELGADGSGIKILRQSK